MSVEHTTHTKASQEETPELIDAIYRHGRGLFQAEWQLAKAEMQRSASSVARAVIFFGCAAFLMLVMFHALAVAAILGLMALGFTGWVAGAITTGGLLVLAIICALIGKSQLRAKRLTPDRTLSQLRTDYQAVKETIRA